MDVSAAHDVSALQEHRLGRRQLATTATPVAEIREAVVEYRHAVAGIVGGVVVVVGVVHHAVVAVGVVMVVVVVYREGGGGWRRGRREGVGVGMGVGVGGGGGGGQYGIVRVDARAGRGGGPTSKNDASKTRFCDEGENSISEFVRMGPIDDDDDEGNGRIIVDGNDDDNNASRITVRSSWRSCTRRRRISWPHRRCRD